MSVEKKKILIEASGCHVHLTQAAIETLFGEGAVLKKRRDLSQPGEYLSEQRVKLVTKDGCVENVAVLGPPREAVQVELSRTDCRKLGLTAPVNLSGNLDGASDVMIIGSHGEMKANGSVIVARNHIHMRPQEATVSGSGWKWKVTGRLSLKMYRFVSAKNLLRPCISTLMKPTPADTGWVPKHLSFMARRVKVRGCQQWIWNN